MILWQRLSVVATPHTIGSDNIFFTMRSLFKALINVAFHLLSFAVTSLLLYYFIIWISPAQIIIDNETHPVMPIGQVFYALLISFILNLSVIIFRLVKKLN